jgi:integrase/recombinase XerD
VPVGRRALAWVEKYLDASRPLLVVNPDEQALFLTAYGSPFSPIALSHKVREYLQRAGIGQLQAVHAHTHPAERAAPAPANPPPTA